MSRSVTLSAVALVLIALVGLALTFWPDTPGPLPGSAQARSQEAVSAAERLLMRPIEDHVAPTAGADPAPARSAVDLADSGVFVVRGRVQRDRDARYAGARIEVQRIDGYDAAAAPSATDVLTCDDDGCFAWSLPTPKTGLVLRFRSAMPRHQAREEVVRVPLGDPAPQDVVLWISPLDVAVRGDVTDASGRPVDGAWVRSSGDPVACAKDGSYELDASRAFGRLQITAGAPGHECERRTIDVAGDTATADFRLGPSFRVSGRVVDEVGAPVAGAAVRAFAGLGAAAETDLGGRFVLDGLDPDRESYSIAAHKAGFVEATAKLSPKRPPGELELVLRRGARVSGRVLGPDGAALPGAELYIGFSPNAWNSLDAVAGDDGRFTFEAVGSGAQTLVTQRRGLAPDHRVLQIDDDLRDLDVTIRLGAGHRIEGIVVDELGEPLPDIRIAVRVRGQYIDVHASSGRDGRFALSGLPPGEVVLDAYTTGRIRVELPIRVEDAAEVRIAMPRSASIAGRVVDAETGQPIDAFNIRIVRHGSSIGATWVREGRDFRDPQGLWSTGSENLKEGSQWGVEAVAAGYAPARVLDVVATVDPDPERCVLRLRRGGIVEGSVVDRETGAPVGGAMVTWFVDEQDLRQAQWEPYGLIRARTDAQGRFALEDVPPGEATTLAVDGPTAPRHVDGPFDLASGARVVRRIELGRGARISGTVVDHDGTTGVAVLDLSPLAAPGAERARLETLPDGSFAFERLPPGDYQLSGYLRRGLATVPVAGRVTLEAEQRVELRLAPEGAAIVRGTLRGPFAAGETVVWLSTTEPGSSESRIWRGATFGSTFELRGIPAGDYRLSASSGGARGRARVVVPESGVVTVEVELATPR